MTKTINCTSCHRCISIQGATDGTKEISQNVTCPYCQTPNEVDWPMGTSYIVGRCDGDEIPQ